MKAASTMGRTRGAYVACLGAVAVMASAYSLGACSKHHNDNNVPTTPVNTGAVTVQVTDAAYPYDVLDSVNVTFGSIQLRGPNNTLESIVPASSVANTDSSGISNTASASTTTVDVLKLRNGATATIANGVAPIGSYSSLVVTITNVLVQLKDGRQIASGQNAQPVVLDLPLSPELGVTQNGNTTILFDMDLARSLILSGGTTPTTITDFAFTPTGRAMVVGTGGNIQGTVQNQTGQGVQDADVRALNSGATIASTKTDANGGFAFLELAPGTYSVTAERGDLAAVSSQVTVERAQTTTIDRLTLTPR
jgi:hypothetical protein